jgi:hypothetical protein
MGVIVDKQGDAGYATGFAVFVVLAFVSLIIAYTLQRTHLQ